MAKHPRMPEPTEQTRKRVQDYRARCRKEGYARIDLWIPPEIEQQFQQLMVVRQLGRKELAITLIQEAAARLEKQGESSK